MKLSYVLVLLTVSVMPSSAENLFSPTQGDYLDSNARYRSTRHHHGRRSHSRPRRSSHIYEPNRYVTPSTPVAKADMAPFDWENYQPPVRWTDVDFSTVLKPFDFVNFPPDPAPFKLPADPPNTNLLLEPPEQGTLYLFALAILAVLGTGAASEVNKLRTCHKSLQSSWSNFDEGSPNLLAELVKQCNKLPPLLERLQKRLSELTLRIMGV